MSQDKKCNCKSCANPACRCSEPGVKGTSQCCCGPNCQCGEACKCGPDCNCGASCAK